MIANELIYVGTESGEILAIDYRGELKWRFHAKRSITSSPAASAQAVYVASLDGVLYSLGAQDGWAVWRFRLGKGSVSSPALVDNLLIVGAADGFIYCVEIQTGREVWRFRTEHQVSSSPAIYRDAVYCGSVDGNLYCLGISNRPTALEIRGRRGDHRLGRGLRRHRVRGCNQPSGLCTARLNKEIRMLDRLRRFFSDLTSRARDRATTAPLSE